MGLLDVLTMTVTSWPRFDTPGSFYGDNMRRLDSVRVIQVIEVRGIRGAGIDESDPVRNIARYYSLDGTLLAESDPTMDSPNATVTK